MCVMISGEKNPDFSFIVILVLLLIVQFEKVV